MKVTVLFCLLCGLAAASDFRLSDDLYQEALKDMAKPDAAATVDASIEWSRCVELMIQANPEGELALIALVKKMNLLASDADVAELITTHELMIKGDSQAVLKVAIALIKGEFGYLIFPKCPSLALPYLESLLTED